MKLGILPALWLIGSSFAAPTPTSTILQARDLTVINYNIKRVQDTLKYVDALLTRKPSYTASTQQWVPFFQDGLQAARLIVEELTVGAADIRRGPASNDLEAIVLRSQASALLTILNRVVADLLNIKRQAVAVGAQSAVLDVLLQSEGAVGPFIDSISSKVGSVGVSVLTTYKQQFVAAIQKGVKEYRKK